MIWFLINCVEVEMAASRETLELAVLDPRWRFNWPAAPWLLGVVGLAVAHLRSTVDADSTALQNRIRQTARVCFAAAALKLLSLWDLPTYFIPFITALWSPHCTWALSLTWLLYIHLPAGTGQCLKRLTPGRAASIAFVMALGVYGAYTFYFCQVTLIHGDEGQYLRVTQSLLRDGDMDLANNLDDDHIAEFHDVRFDVHKAASSPPGKLYSVHPIGLSIMLAPVYELGMRWWGNPRLACALAVAAVAAGCVALSLLWLLRLGVRQWVAWAATLILAGSTPLFLFCNQLFPDVPALFIFLMVLAATAHWQRPAGSYRSMKGPEPVWIALLTALLVALPFLHARFAPIALFAAALLVLQSWFSPRRTQCLAAFGMVALLGCYSVISFNYAFSGDWLGPFRPGNAWEEGALKLSTWSVSLPGHWLHVRKGIVNSAPIFLLSVVGLVLLGRRRDRRFGVALAIYGVSALVNGLHTDWGFGFCYPARFLLTALPALILCLAVALEVIRHRPIGFFLALVALAIGVDGLQATMAVPEMGYDGHNLANREINRFYPWHVHFYSASHSNAYLTDLLVWGLLVSGAIHILLADRSGHRLRTVGGLAAACLIVFLWGRTEALGNRLRAAVLPDLASFGDGKPLPSMVRSILVHRQLERTGELLEGRRFAAVAGRHDAGLLTSTYMPFLQPGSYRIFLPDLAAHSANEQAPGHLLLSMRTTVPAVSPWERRLLRPLVPVSGSAPEEMRFAVRRPWLGYTHVLFSGAGELSLERINLDYHPGIPAAAYEQIRRYADLESRATGDDMAIAARFSGLETGAYRVRFDLEGSVWASWLQRRPDPVTLAVFVADESGRAIAESQIEAWYAQDRELLETAQRGERLRPLAESIQAPWWVTVPWCADEVYQLEFETAEKTDVWFLAKYSGNGTMRTKAISLSRLR